MPISSLLLLASLFVIVPLVFISPVVGVYAYHWISLLNPHRLVYGVAYSLPFAMFLSGLTLLAWLVSKEPKKLTITAPTAILLALAFWVTFTSFFAQVPDVAWVYWERTLKTFFMALITIALVTSRERIHALVWVLVLSVGVLGIRSGIPTILTAGGHHAYGPPESFINDNNALALVFVMTLPLMRYLHLQSEEKWIRIGILATMVMTSFAIIGTTSRGGFLGLVAIAIALVWKSRQRAAFIALALALGSVLIFFVPQQWVERMETIKEYDQDASAMGRIDAWIFASRLAIERPITGGGFRPYYDSDLFMRLVPDAAMPRAIHSIYFEVLGDHGFVGLGLFLGLLWAAWRSFARAKKLGEMRPDMKWAADLGQMGQASLIGYMVSGAFLSLAYFDHIYTVIALAAALSMVTQKLAKTDAASASSLSQNPALKAQGTRRPAISRPFRSRPPLSSQIKAPTK
ncbi:O-antigen polymerase [Iodidimonas nitroreducens]|uniref:O-antigen polymerase n=1 Tax=Iodidimonas nitroreducens TaxID=1236968 RepID=A0A5A7NBH2_9PROT|nr:putative O-glycosylation ligase, exosortase A system-associated [Iodidimonas nitroreducens]GAK32238.1 putative O-glycosylation ligase, exosortase A-associated [alpha proteobacterium Q-1]GER04840.1 O-antigen polymerase [Iodidimonas nitroreducens]